MVSVISIDNSKTLKYHTFSVKHWFCLLLAITDSNDEKIIKEQR